MKKIQSSIPPKRLNQRIQRIVSVILLYTIFFKDNTKANFEKPISPDEIAEMLGVTVLSPETVYNNIDNITNNIDKLDKLITEFSPKRSIAEFDKISLSILRFAIWESIISKNTPPKVAISEAVEIAKHSVSETNTKLVNAIINKIHEKYSIKD